MRSLFHYTKATTLIEKILPSQSLKTNSLASMNDPRESQPWAFGGVNIPLDQLFPDYYSKQTHIDCQYKFGRMMRDRFQVICFSGAKDAGWNNEMMWAHYGHNQAGVCLEFDENELKKGIQLSHGHIMYCIDDVNYKGQKVKPQITWNKTLSIEENFRSISLACKPMVLTKSQVWEKEDERRLVFLDNEITLEIPIFPSLKAIYFGLYFAYDSIVAIENHLGNLDVDFFDLIYQDDEYKRWPRQKRTSAVPINRKFY